MLSKLRHFSCKHEKALSDLKVGIHPAQLLQQLGGAAINVQSVDGGTLGAGFLLEMDGRHRFLKTHAVQESRETLEKEAAILSYLYQDQIHLKRIDIDNNAAAPRLCLLMDELEYPAADFDMEQVLGIIDGYSQPLKNWADTKTIPADENFACLVEEGFTALQNLAGNGLLGHAVCEAARSRLTLLEKEIDSFPLRVCHGDLGPKNLMLAGADPVAIDWEDAFWGIEGYDYLYWLSFFSNRRYYSHKIFGKTPWGKEIEIAIIVLVMLLKSELSFRANSYKQNTLSFDQRIVEILALA